MLIQPLRLTIRSLRVSFLVCLLVFFLTGGLGWPGIVQAVVDTQEAKVTASDGAVADFFGASVALSDDGNTALVGATSDDVGANVNQGSSYVFTRSGSTWTQQAQLTASDGAASDNFGYSVALSPDGNTALVGAWGDDVGANADQGSSYVFTRSGSTWTEQAQLTASDGAASDSFGLFVALSEDGNTALVGAYLDDVGANADQGSSYVFTRSGSTWTEQAQLTASDGAASDNFGISVALSPDGNTALVGAYLDDVGANANQGSAYAFTRSGSTWTQQAQLTASDGAASDVFGDSVALGDSGNTALVGVTGDDVGANGNQGSAYAFTRSGSTWTQQAQLTASDGAAGDQFGGSVALSPDGNTALVGARNDDVGANDGQGSAYAFTRSGGTWTQQAQLTASDGAASDEFGGRVALSDDGNTALVGAKLNDVGANGNQGSSYVFIEVVAPAAAPSSPAESGAESDSEPDLGDFTLAGGTMVSRRTATGAVVTRREITLVQRPGTTVSAYPPDYESLRSLTLEVAGRVITLSPDSLNPHLFRATLPPLLPQRYKYALRGDWGYTTLSEEGYLILRSSTSIIPAGFPHINRLFRLAFGHEPSFLEWQFWAERLLRGEKPTLPSLLGAMQWLAERQW